MEVGGWLRSLGLGRYEAAFRVNEIDGDVLPNLTAEDLKELGVASVGHRRKMLVAIAELSGSSGLSAGDAKPPVAMTTTSTDTAERRQLTVMFCDLAGSTALSSRLDPEDMRTVIRAYQDACSAVVGRFGGFIAKFMGDGILAYFGYPRAQEDDAECAVRAGLEIATAISALETRAKERLQVRIGIATGLVVVGDLIGEGSAQEKAVVGDTPNLAARLQALAQPNAVVIAASTRRLLGGIFELEALGPQTLKGFAEAVLAWTVLRDSQSVSRFEAARAEGMTPMVGREQEVALLLDRWRNATQCEGQVTLLSGEAGIGKSRILEALQERLRGEPHLVLRYQCSPHHANNAFYPAARQIRHSAGFAPGDSTESRLDKLEAIIAQSSLDSNEIAPVLATLLSIPTGERYPPLELPPSLLRERIISALMALLEGLTRNAPVLFLIEDVHWIDPTTLELASRTVDALQSMRVLLVMTFRPEFVAPWIGHAHVNLLTLNRLGRRQAVAMVERVTGGKALPAEVLEQIIIKTDGVPLFIEELTKTVLESGLLQEQEGAYVRVGALTPLAIPSTLQDSLMARLDRLAPVKEVAQIGAAIGREFSYKLIEAVAPRAGPALEDALHRLVASELIYQRGKPPDASYIFKHALVQDTAYGTLLRSRRQRIHGDIAHALAERFGDQVESAPEVIARHYTEAGLDEPAARAWLAAAELALSRSAYAEADRYVDAGVALVPHLMDGSERHAVELALRIARANALLPMRGYAAPETVAALTEAKRIIDAGTGTNLQRFAVLYGLLVANYVAAQIGLARSLARQYVELAERQNDTTYRLVGARVLGATLLYAGENREALESLKQAEQYRDPIRQKALSYRFGSDPSLAVLYYKCWALWSLGLPDQAACLGRQVLEELPSHGHANTVAAATFFAAVLPAMLAGDLDALERHSTELLTFCTEKTNESFRQVAAVAYASARAMRRPTAENIAAARATIEANHRAGARASNSAWLSQLVKALLMAGDVTGAEAELRGCFAFVEQSGERYWLAELHRLDGQIALRQSASDAARAEACFQQAIEIARQQEARMLEVRAATDVGWLWYRGGRPGGEVRALLEPMLAAIEGGETTLDVWNARALLATIESNAVRGTSATARVYRIPKPGRSDDEVRPGWRVI